MHLNYFTLKPVVKVIIPAYNEEDAIVNVIREIPREIVSEVIVVNNGSKDNTAQVAASAGATVLNEPTAGYGRACLKGIGYLKPSPPDIVVFLDGDYSDYPDEISMLIAPIVNDQAELVIGSRALGEKQRDSMTPQQIFGNWLATRLLRLLYKVHFTDLGPFRAIRYEKLIALNMLDKNYGWTVEMQLKAAKAGLKCAEIPVRYRKRIGVSKVSGTMKGTIMAGYKIIATIFKYW